MTILKNTDRKQVIDKALEDAFAPRFNEFAKRLRARYAAQIAEAHPVFAKLVKNSDARPYLAVSTVREFYLGGRPVLTPKYGARCELPEAGWIDRDLYAWVQGSDMAVPADCWKAKIEDADFSAEYIGLWRGCAVARTTLSELLNSYAVREKFAEDFPELAKYLPPIEVKARLPAVIVADVRSKLAAVGVPSK